MSRDNVEIVCRAARAWNERGWEAVIKEGLLHPEVEYHDDENWPGARSAHGRTALLEHFDEVMDLVALNGHAEVEQTADGGDYVGIVLCLRGEGAASHIPYEYKWGYLCRVRERQIDYIQAYLDANAALQAAGRRA
jgi:ketosteroid isomerase-like protein